MRKIKESEIQSIIIDYLILKENIGELTFQRINNTPIWDKNRFRAMPKGTKKGYPDILIIKNGNCIGIEIKSEFGKQSIHQKKTENTFIKNGAKYYIIKNLEDLKIIIE